MSKILQINEAAKLVVRLRKQNQRLVLAGGCFDILHQGHVAFLQKAKEHGEILIVLLESDQKIRETKGHNRPINNQQNRAIILSALSAVDYVILLPYLSSNDAYDEMILRLKPAIIATTKTDPQRNHKERQADLARATVVDVIDKIDDASTTRIAALLAKEL